jgi:PAS domain S-box-containing protein
MHRAQKAEPSKARRSPAAARQAERYRNLIEQAADGIFLLDKQGVFLDVNESGLRLLGMRREELLGEKLRNLVFEPDLPAHKADWNALEGGKPFLVERRLKRKDGTVIPVEVSARKLSDGNVQGILRDISHRKQAELELRQREERFRNLTAAAFEGIGINEAGKVVDVNDQLAQMFGYTREELLGQNVSVMIAPESRALVQEAIQTGREGPYEHLAVRKDGTVFEAEVRAKPGLWGGRPVRVSAVRDITERKKAAAAMLRQLTFNELLNKVLSRFATCAAPDADAAVVEALQAIAQFIGADHAYVVLFSPDRTMWGASHEWCARHVPPQFHHYQELPLGTRPWSEARVLAGELIRLDSLHQYPPEASRDLEMVQCEGALSVLSAPVRGQAGQLTGCVGLHAHAQPIVWSDADEARLRMVGDAIANLLERKRVEESLRELSHRLHRAQDEERRRIARELHDSTAQLLAAVMMNLGALEQPSVLRGGKAAGLVRESLDLVERCTQEVRILSYRLHPPLLDQMGLEPALRSYVQGFAQRSGIEVALDLACGEERLPEEVELALFRVVQEGLGNIHRHSGSRTVRIALRRKAEAVLLEVADQGTGMPPKTLDAIQNGTVMQGVGLAAMQERLREIGASLEVESSAAGTRLRAVVLLGSKQAEQEIREGEIRRPKTESRNKLEIRRRKSSKRERGRERGRGRGRERGRSDQKRGVWRSNS